jgi:hypothetical protein
MKKYKIKYKKNELIGSGLDIKLKNTVIISDNDNNVFRKKNYNSGFGFLKNEGFNKIIKISKNKLGDISNKTFADLGSGDGRIVIWASKFFNKSIGIELSETRHLEAINIKSKLPNNNNIFLYNDDILNYNYSDLDVIYISSLLFPEHLMEKLSIKILNEVKENTLIFSSRLLKINNFYDEIKINQSWSDNQTLFVYKF